MSDYLSRIGPPALEGDLGRGSVHRAGAWTAGVSATAAGPAGPNVQNVVFDLGENLTKGEDTAKLTMVEFTDYQ
ncbi:MAG TPA: hypothetical protein VGC53_21025 [Vicinamibacteria bacterium]